MAAAACSQVPELCSLIVSHLLALGSIASYATVSKQWRSAVEFHTFSSIRLTTSRLDDFARIVVGGRRGAVRRLDLDIVLEPYSDEARGEIETSAEQDRNDELFTEAFHRLFDILATWRQTDVCKGGIELSTKAYSLSDPSHASAAEMKQRRLAVRMGSPRDFMGQRFEKSYLRFIAPMPCATKGDALPEVSVLTKVSITSSISGGERSLRRVWPASAAVIASKLPRLRHATFRLIDGDKRDPVLRRERREEFGNYLVRLPPSVSDLDLTYAYYPPNDHSFSPPNIISPGNSDLLSCRLREFSQQLTSINLSSIVISPELFWPADVESSQPPHWPHLTSVKITFQPVTPAGEWLFERDPMRAVINDGESAPDLSMYVPDEVIPAREDWKFDSFRSKPIDRSMNDLYLAAGFAVSEMPRLREMSLMVRQDGQPLQRLTYRVEATTATLKVVSVPPRDLWDPGYSPAFELEESVLKVWEDAARKNAGADLDAEFVSEPPHFMHRLR